MDDRIARDRQLLIDARQKGRGAMLGAFIRLSGPGWLQGAITLGGGSLAGALYLGVLAGYSMLWLQVLAMLAGVTMLSAIGYVTLATGQRPFRAINEYINPVLGWGWAIATMLANMVWLMPQFALGTAAIRQNLMPGVVGEASGIPETSGKIIVVAVLLVVAGLVVWSYDRGGRGIKIFDIILKIMVAVVVLSFFGVVATLASSLPWGEVLSGFVPDLGMLFAPSDNFRPYLDAVADPQQREFWSNVIVAEQRDVMVTAAATAVGINMTFFLPYSMLARGWDRNFRGLAIFDLSTGLFIPFVLATSCVVIASASQFHTTPEPGFLGEKDDQGALIVPADNIIRGYNGLASRRLKEQVRLDGLPELSTSDRDAITTLMVKRKVDNDTKFEAMTAEQIAAVAATCTESDFIDAYSFWEPARAALPEADKMLAAMLVQRDAFNLARTLEPLTGREVAHYVFGIGVVGMALSSIIMLMLINGFVVCEMLGLPSGGTPHRIGCFIAAASGMLGPFIFSGKAAFWLAVPTSVFGMVLLPVAYLTFFLLMNQKKLLGKSMPTGMRRVRWNVLMAIAFFLSAIGSVWSVWSKARWYGIAGLAAFMLLVAVVHFLYPRKALPLAEELEPQRV